MAKTALLINLSRRDLAVARDELTSLGFEVRTASEGSAGKRVFEGVRPDLTIIAGGAKGRTLCRALRETEHGANARIMLLSAARCAAASLEFTTEVLTVPLPRGEIERVMSDARPRATPIESIRVQAARRPGTIDGDMAAFPPAELLQTFNLGGRTARITLLRDGEQGRIWLAGGSAYHASVGVLEGAEAFYSMVGWDRGDFVVEHDIRCAQRTIDMDTMFLVMEGLRRLDEAQAGSSAPEPEPVGYATLESAPRESAPAPLRRSRPWLALIAILTLPLAIGSSVLLLHEPSDHEIIFEQIEQPHELFIDPDSGAPPIDERPEAWLLAWVNDAGREDS